MKTLLNKIKNFLFFDWKTQHGEIKYWKIAFFLFIIIFTLIDMSFNSYIVKVTEPYVTMNQYYINGYDFNSKKNRVFKIEESWSFGIFDAASFFGNINKDKIYHINTFGIRISIPPFFSTFPNIISASEIQVK